MEGTREEKELITHSRKVAFRACRRRHHLTYDLGYRAIRQSKPLLVGDALHKWLERWFHAGGQSWICPFPAEGAEISMYTPDPHEEMWFAFRAVEREDPFEAAKLRAMVLAYHLRWHLQRWTVLAVEQEFRAPLVNPLTGRTSQGYERAGKLDAVIAIDFEDGGPEFEGQWIVEHKSNKGPLDVESSYWTRLRMDPQCSDYFIGAQALGFKPRGIIYDVVCKPTIEPYKATPPEKRKYTQGNGCKVCGGSKGKAGHGFMVTDLEYPEAERGKCSACKGSGWRIGEEPQLYANTRIADETPGEYGLRCFQTMLAEPHRYLHRHKVVRLEVELRDHLIDDWYTVKSIHETKGLPGGRNPDACFLFGRPCDFLPVCSRSASIDDPKLYQIARKHPELRVVTDA